jgi:hypothetical protein
MMMHISQLCPVFRKDSNRQHTVPGMPPFRTRMALCLKSHVSFACAWVAAITKAHQQWHFCTSPEKYKAVQKAFLLSSSERLCMHSKQALLLPHHQFRFHAGSLSRLSYWRASQRPSFTKCPLCSPHSAPLLLGPRQLQHLRPLWTWLGCAVSQATQKQQQIDLHPQWSLSNWSARLRCCGGRAGLLMA